MDATRREATESTPSSCEIRIAHHTQPVRLARCLKLYFSRRDPDQRSPVCSARDTTSAWSQDPGPASFALDDPPRARRRRRIEYPGLGTVDEFLTIGLTGRVQVIVCTIAPGGGTGPEAYAHDSDEEVVVVLEGSIDLWVGDDHHVLDTGDAITYSSRLAHSSVNNGTIPAVVLFCVTPPSF